MVTKKLKVGDCVEVMRHGGSGILVGEQGIVIEDSDQGSIQLIFPARNDYWEEHEWWTVACNLKLVYRPRISNK